MFAFIDIRFVFCATILYLVFEAFCILRYCSQLQSEAATRRTPKALPSATLIIPCKGASDDLEDNIRSLVRQNYPGSWTVICVVASESFPAHARLRGMIEEGEKFRLLVSQAKPLRCCEQVLNLLHGVAAAPPESQVLCFADCDIRVEPDWAARLAEALEEPNAEVAGTAMMFIPSTLNGWAFLRMLWFAAGLPFSFAFPRIMGCSMAVRRSFFERAKIAELWGRSVNHDSVLNRAVRREGGRIRLLAGELPLTFDDCSAGDFFRIFHKWFLYTRIYDPLAWSLAASFVLGKTWILLWSLRGGVWQLFALTVIGDMALTGIVLALLGRFHPKAFDRIAPPFRHYIILGTLAAPLVLPIYLINLLSSLFAREVRWGGYVYRFHGPFEIEVVS